jgi:hypothetical protein
MTASHSPDVDRLSQLSQGLRAAAAALPLDHKALGERIASLAERLQAAAGNLSISAADQTAGAAVRDALADVERLHFDLIKLEVHGGEPTGLGIVSRVDGLDAAIAALEDAAAAPG